MLAFDNGKGRQKVAQGTEKAFGIVMACFFFGLFAYEFLKNDILVYGEGFVATGFLLIAFFRPQMLTRFNFIWFKLGLLLHKITNPIIMGILFYFIFTPIALLLKIKKKDLLKLKFQPDIHSYWIERLPPGPEPKTMEKQF